ncbi:MAG: hypothetical protein QOE36_3482 [Gaiellaceae bacterium]|jgi:hypothetical protein|nr:hypothetical protein [Gaiellaceae bacterium]
MRRGALALVCFVAAGCGAGGPKTTVTFASHLRVTSVELTADTHTPKAGAKWSYAVRVTDGRGRPLPARVHLQILFGGAPVGQVGAHRVRGLWRETLGTPRNPPWPARSRGVPLTFQAVVTANGMTVKRNWWIRVR